MTIAADPTVLAVDPFARLIEPITDSVLEGIISEEKHSTARLHRTASAIRHFPAARRFSGAITALGAVVLAPDFSAYIAGLPEAVGFGGSLSMAYFAAMISGVLGILLAVALFATSACQGVLAALTGDLMRGVFALVGLGFALYGISLLLTYHFTASAMAGAVSGAIALCAQRLFEIAPRNRGRH